MFGEYKYQYCSPDIFKAKCSSPLSKGELISPGGAYAGFSFSFFKRGSGMLSVGVFGEES
jgi:hypothetical protein